MRGLALALLLALALSASGCASPEDGATLSSSTTTTAAAAPVTPAAEPPAPEPVTVVCDVVRTQAGTSLGLGLFVDRAVLDDPGCYLDDLFGDAVADAASLLVEIEWSPQATMTGANAWVEASDCQSTPLAPCPLPEEQATTSPLRLTLEGDEFAAHAQADLGVQVAAQGVVAQQEFTVHLTLFVQPAVPLEFTALA